MSAELLATFDPDKIDEMAKSKLQSIPPDEMTPALEEKIRKNPTI